MCWTGSRAARRAISSQNLGSKLPSGTVCSAERSTPCRCAAISSASVRGESTPASASRAAATAISSSSRLMAVGGSGPVRPAGGRGAVRPAGSRGLLRTVGRHQGVDHGIQVTVDDLVEVVGLVADPVIGYPVLREVVRPHPLRPVHVGHLAAPLGGGLLGGGLLRPGEQPGAQDAQRLLLVLQLALLVLAGQ